MRNLAESAHALQAMIVLLFGTALLANCKRTPAVTNQAMQTTSPIAVTLEIREGSSYDALFDCALTVVKTPLLRPANPAGYKVKPWRWDAFALRILWRVDARDEAWVFLRTGSFTFPLQGVVTGPLDLIPPTGAAAVHGDLGGTVAYDSAGGFGTITRSSTNGAGLRAILTPLDEQAARPRLQRLLSARLAEATAPLFKEAPPNVLARYLEALEPCTPVVSNFPAFREAVELVLESKGARFKKHEDSAVRSWKAESAEIEKRVAKLSGVRPLASRLSVFDTIRLTPLRFDEPFDGSAVYFDASDRWEHLVLVNTAGLLTFVDGELLDGKYIFVMAPNGFVFASHDRTHRKKPEIKGIFHSSFLAGAPVAAAGELRVSKGDLEACNNGSGHYKPPLEIVRQLETRLKELGANRSPTCVSF